MRTAALCLVATVSMPALAYAQVNVPAIISNADAAEATASSAVAGASAGPNGASGAAAAQATAAPSLIPAANAMTVPTPLPSPQFARPTFGAERAVPNPNSPEEKRRALEESVPRTMPPAVPMVSPEHGLSRNAQSALAVASRWQTRPARPRMGADGRVRFTFGNAEPNMVCAPLHWCDIELQHGEAVLQPAQIGDPRWLAHLTMSGSGASRTTHVVIKPSDNGLDSNIVIETSRRTYSIRLVSSTRGYMPLVAFDYADDGREVGAAYAMPAGGAGSPCDQTPVFPPGTYEMSAGNYAWRPLQVYAVSTPVGIKTCIEFASGITSTSLPALVAVAEPGSWFSDPVLQVVNFRYETQRHRYVVDENLQRFKLIQGIGDEQRKITVTQRGAP